MDASDDEILEQDMELRELERDESSEAIEADDMLDYPSEDFDGSDCPEQLFEPEPAPEFGNGEQVEQRVERRSSGACMQFKEALARTQLALNKHQLSVTNEYLDSIKHGDETAMSCAKGAGGKWKKRKRNNPFISFFLSMYSRRPHQRVVEVARQAGRQWGRMSDTQRKLYNNSQHSPSQPP